MQQFARNLGWKTLCAASCKEYLGWQFKMQQLARNLLLEIVDAYSLQEIIVGNSWCSLQEMEERKTKSAALVFHRFAGAEFKEVTGLFCW